VGPRLFYCDHHPIPLPPGHKFPIEKYARLHALLAADGVYDLLPAPPADAATIELAHDTAYVRAILDGEDASAKYHVLCGVVASMPAGVREELRDSMSRLTRSPTAAEVAEELPGIAAELLADDRRQR